MLTVQAVADAEEGATLAPGWPKPLHRLAQAQAGLRRWAPAVAACRTGAAMPGHAPSTYKGFSLLLDSIAVDAAAAGDLSGFCGRRLEVLPIFLGPRDPPMHTHSSHVSVQQLVKPRVCMACNDELQVRDAGEEAWLGREAPFEPALDQDPDEEPPLLLMPPPTPGAGDDKAVIADAEGPGPAGALSVSGQLHLSAPISSL